MARMRGDYGQDAPSLAYGMFAGGLVMIVAGVVLGGAPYLLWPGASIFITGAWMIVGSRVLKMKTRDRVLDRAGLRAGARVLDVGCGRGLLLIGAARRIGDGNKAIGIDLWRTRDQSGNDPEVTKRNAVAEGVGERIELHTGDMTQMPFADASFDAIVSTYAIHNVPSREGRSKALHEIARVLAPGGRVSIVDIGPGRAYDRELGALGLVDVKKQLDNVDFLIPAWSTTASKPR
jgi:SAM-dependent methyltransferase